MKKKTLTVIFALGLSLHLFGTARADPFLDEMVGFEGEMFLAQHKVPALVIAVVRDGEVSVKGFGERAGPGSPPPDGDTLMRIGSITKPFAGLVLAHFAAEGKVRLATPLVVSVHTVVSFDFAVAIVPGWHTPIFPPYFVAGAIYSGFAMVLTLAIPIRAIYGLEDFITLAHLQNMAKVMLVTGE